MIAVQEINTQEAYEIIRDPSNAAPALFLHEDNGLYVGIDNTTYDAWTEEFSTKKDCLNWLRRE